MTMNDFFSLEFDLFIAFLLCDCTLFHCSLVKKKYLLLFKWMSCVSSTYVSVSSAKSVFCTKEDFYWTAETVGKMSWFNFIFSQDTEKNTNCQGDFWSAWLHNRTIYYLSLSIRSFVDVGTIYNGRVERTVCKLWPGFSFKQSKNKLTSSTKRGETHCFIMSKAYVWPGPSWLTTPLCTARSDGLIVVSAGTWM